MSGRVGIVGVGNMGGRMARRVLDAGLDLVGFDPDPAQLERHGVPGRGSTAELVASVDVVLLSLPDSAVVEAVVYGADGLAAHCREGQVVVDLSTAAPASTRRINADLHAHGVDYVDAGISGGAAAAEKGRLSIMAGGSKEALERVDWVLRCFSDKVFYMGPSGNGHATKLLNNFLNAVSLAATSEVMVAARQAGLDLERVLEVLNASSGVNFATLNRFPRIIQGDYLEGGLTGELMVKDILLYLELTEELAVPTPNAPGCLATFRLANALGYGDQISNRVVDGLGDLAGGLRLQPEAAPTTRESR
jgi:3-hydroxyisobutyrate dehydrogenase